MIDLLIALIIGSVFIAGFKAGNRFTSLTAMLQTGLDALKK